MQSRRTAPYPSSLVASLETRVLLNNDKRIVRPLATNLTFPLQPLFLLPYSALPGRPYRPVAQDTALSRR